MKTLLNILSLALVIAVPIPAFGAASGENTAAHVKAYAQELEGERVTLDVVFIRIHRHAPEDVPYAFFWALTMDEDARAPGGAILVVADAEDRDSLIRRYGTNLDRDNRGVEHESMRGVVRIIQRPNGKRIVYLDITANGVDLSNAPEGMFEGEPEASGSIEAPGNQSSGANLPPPGGRQRPPR